MSISISGVCHSFGEQVLLNDINLVLGSDKYGLVGPNGAGKSTFAKIIAGLLVPNVGAVTSSSKVFYFSQDESLPDCLLSELLADVWDVKEARTSIAELLSGIDLERRYSELSGGEKMRVRLARLHLQPGCFLILDEPSNNLDREGREYLLKFIDGYCDGLLLISHDRELLGRVSTIFELSNQGLSTYGGNFECYWEQRELERCRAAENLHQLKRKRDDAIADATERAQEQERRGRHGRARAERRDASRFEAQGMKRTAQKSSGKIIQAVSDAAREAAIQASDAWDTLKQDPFIRLNFEGARVPNDKVVLAGKGCSWRFRDQHESLWSEPITFCIRGSERWRISGGNGSGKSTLVKLALGRFDTGLGILSGTLQLGVNNISYLDQNYSTLNPALSIFDNIKHRSRFSPIELRNELAFYGLTGDKATRPVSTLSGGERLKAALAEMFLGEAIPELIVLDEPTNNLDLMSVRLLEQALQGFKGAVVVISHDDQFVKALAVGNELKLT